MSDRARYVETSGSESIIMKQTFRNIGLAVFYIYFLSTILAAAYFNWAYFNEHGFMRWLVFGDVIATAKSVIWPYYAVVGFGSGRSSCISCLGGALACLRDSEVSRVVSS